MHLSEIIGFAKERILHPKKGAEHKSQVRYAIDLTMQKLEMFVKSIDPTVDAHAAAIATLVQAGGHSDSHKCLETAAQALLKNIGKQNEGCQAVFSRGSISYVPTHLVMQDQNLARGLKSGTQKKSAMFTAQAQNGYPGSGASFGSAEDQMAIAGVSILAGSLLFLLPFGFTQFLGGALIAAGIGYGGSGLYDQSQINRTDRGALK